MITCISEAMNVVSERPLKLQNIAALQKCAYGILVILGNDLFGLSFSYREERLFYLKLLKLAKYVHFTFCKFNLF